MKKFQGPAKTLTKKQQKTICGGVDGGGGGSSCPGSGPNTYSLLCNPSHATVCCNGTEADIYSNGIFCHFESPGEGIFVPCP
jgi:hypothetical protein